MKNINAFKKNEIRGAVLAAKGDEVLYEEASGCRDLPNEIPNNMETRFASASAGKVFVAVSILQLIEAKKLSFETTLGELDLFDLHDIDPNITVRELLTHTSGMPDYFDESVMDEYEELWVDFPCYRIRHNRDLLPLFIDKPMMYPRGERFQYNNTGFVVLAMAVEKLTGMEFDKYIGKNVFAPCDMDSCGYFELDRLPRNCANNYIETEDGSLRTNIFSVDTKGTGAGGTFITVGDINKFWQGLCDGKLISKDMVNEMTSIQSGDEDEGYYGYGVWISHHEDQSGDMPFIQGCDPGVSFVSMCKRTERLTMTIVSNYGDDVWQAMADMKKELL